MSGEIMYPIPEAVASADDFREKLIEFRGEVWDFFDAVARRYSSDGLAGFTRAANEFDARLFYMATGIKPNLEATTYQFLIKEIEVRQDVILGHFDNKDTLKDADSFNRMMPRATNFVRAAMVSNDALTEDAKAELKKLDNLSF